MSNRHMKGGQATAVPVRHEDGHEGMFRQLKTPVNTIAQARFRRELEILSCRIEHRSIVTLYDWSGDSERPWYISELGIPFASWWSNCREQFESDPERLVSQAIFVLVELSSALAVCHGQGIVHRDIKPKNLIVKKGVTEPWPILIDFGLAHHEIEERLTASDQAVGNARFSPDIMRSRLEQVPPWLDIFDLAQLLIWMLEIQSSKSHWQRPIHWRYAVYSDAIPDALQQSLRAFTAACSTQTTSPMDGAEATKLLDTLFPNKPSLRLGGLDPNIIANAKKRGEAIKQLAVAEIQEELQSAAPLAEKVYLDLKDTLQSVAEELVQHDSSTRIMLDNPFTYQLVGATELFCMFVGPQERNIQLRIKMKIVSSVSQLEPHQENNRVFWRKYMADDSLCFTFALEGGVVQASDSRYLEGRWITLGRDGSIRLHPLEAGFGHYAHNDLGGSVKGLGVPSSLTDVRAFAISVFTKEKYWEFIMAG